MSRVFRRIGLGRLPMFEDPIKDYERQTQTPDQKVPFNSTLPLEQPQPEKTDEQFQELKRRYKPKFYPSSEH
jgi:hypothetical protein